MLELRNGLGLGGWREEGRTEDPAEVGEEESVPLD